MVGKSQESWPLGLDQLSTHHVILFACLLSNKNLEAFWKKDLDDDLIPSTRGFVKQPFHFWFCRTLDDFKFECKAKPEII